MKSKRFGVPPRLRLRDTRRPAKLVIYMRPTLPRRRLFVFMSITFTVTWGAWWSVALLLPKQGLMFDDLPIMALYMLGGFGPTIAAFVAVLATPAEGTFGDFNRALFRWRINPAWYLVAFLLPAALAFASLQIVLAVEPDSLQFVLQPMRQVLPLFGMMIVGGGLEELGWRGVAQPALELRTRRITATTIVVLVLATRRRLPARL